MAAELLNYTPYPFEKNLDKALYAQWLKDEWSLSFYYSGIYVVAIMGGKYVMQDRQPLAIRPLLVAWSAVLAVFSICGAVRMIPETILAIQEHGFEYSICNPSYANHDITAFWVFMFAMSKVYELGDTAFIVLRKQKLIFLHWYHHITVFIYTWYSCMEQTAPGRWFIVMNYTVHSLMYTYYTLRALRLTIPKWVNMLITSMQIVQMLFGLVFNIWTYFAQRAGRFCQQTDTNRICACLMYVSYLVLFSNFFYHAYFTSSKKQVKVSENGSIANGKIANGRVENGVAKKIQ